MVIDKNLLSKRASQEKTDEIFAPLKAKLVNVIKDYENLIQNAQSYIMQNIDDCVAERSHYANSIANVENNFVFNVKFNAVSNQAYAVHANTSSKGINYSVSSKYYYSFDTELVDLYHIPIKEAVNLAKRYKKYLNNTFPSITDIDVNDSDNAFVVNFNIDDYLKKAAGDFSRLAVAYLAKQGIKSRAVQSGNEVKVIIERDTDTGGFEDI